jgi:mRNA interferase RelE/StbE
VSYDVILMPSAQRDLDGFHGKLISRFEEHIMGLASNPRPHGSKKLRGSGARYRLRSGKYRILYEIEEDQKVVRVYRIVHRKDAYR